MILASGAFDGLHSGHVKYLRKAAEVDLLHKLMVAIAPDTYVEHEKLRKVMWTQEQRAEVVLALRCVDMTVDQTTNSVAPLILDLKPAYFVKGEDWIGRLPQDVLDACAEVGAKIVFVEAEGTHTSEARG